MADITITEGDTLEVDYSLENTGDGTGTFDPRLLVQGVQEDQDTGITLDPTQTATGTLEWPTESGDAVTDALAEAVTDDTSDSILVTVESAIPDSVIHRYDPSALSLSNGDNVSTLPDQGSGADLTAGTAPEFQTNVVNGEPVVHFDHTNVEHLSASPTNIAQPFTVMFVNRVGTADFHWTWQTNAGHGLQARTDGAYRLDGTNNLDSSSLNNGNFALHTIIYDGVDTQYRYNGSNDVNGTAASDDFQDWVMGTTFTQTNVAQDVDFGEFVVHNQDLRGSATLTDEEQRLADKYGITLS